MCVVVADVVESLMSAINQRKKEDAIKYLQALLACDAETGSVDMRVNQTLQEPKVKEFM